MLAKMPQQKIKTSSVNNKLVVLLVVIIAGLGLTAAYTMIPLLQTTEPVYLTSNFTNNTPTHAPVAVHIKKTNTNSTPNNSTKVIQKTPVQNSTHSSSSKGISDTQKSSSG